MSDIQAEVVSAVPPAEHPDILAGVLRLIEGLPVLDACKVLNDAKATVLATEASGASPNDLFAPLSPSEREVVSLLIQGLANRDIGTRLFISPKTVDTHRTKIFRKLGVHHIAELVRLAALHGRLT